jgi:flagellar biosynthesis/type III secretory pathway protein FliH
LSLKATGHASVRTTPAGQVTGAGVWSLMELALPAGTGLMGKVLNAEPREVPSQITADEKAKLIDEGYARGLRDGEAKARAAAQASVVDALSVVREVSTQLSEINTMAPAILEENVAAIAIIVARQIIGREITLDKDLISGLVRRALTEFPVDQSVRIRVNPVDLSILSTASGDATQITGKRDVSWLADPRVSRGGCLVEGSQRIVDGRVDTALERAYRRMAQVHAS